MQYHSSRGKYLLMMVRNGYNLESNREAIQIQAAKKTKASSPFYY